MESTSVPTKALEQLAYIDEVREVLAKHGFALDKPADYDEVMDAKLKEFEERLQEKMEEAESIIQMLIADHDSSGHC
jgi:uncharacterized coiled-coil protein SlyX